MKYFFFFLVVICGILTTIFIQYTFTYQSVKYPIAISSCLFFIAGLIIRRANYRSFHPTILYILFSFSFLVIQVYGLRENFAGLKFLSSTLIIVSFIYFLSGYTFSKSKHKILFSSILVFSSIITSLYIIPKLFFTDRVDKVDQTIADDWELIDKFGNTLNAKKVKNKLLLVSFWDSKCSLCFQKAPYIKEVKDEINDPNVIILEVNTGRTDSYHDFIATSKKYKIIDEVNPVYDNQSKLSDILKVDAVPHQFLIKNNRVLYSINGFEKDDKFFLVRETINQIKNSSF